MKMVEYFGQMGITLPQWESGLTGKWWNAMSNAKAIPKKTSNSIDSFNSLIPRQLAAGFFMCAWHDAQAAVPDESLEHDGPP